jgi:hypothetical protein
MFCGFPKEKKHTWASSRKDGLVHSRYNITYPITMFLLFMLTIFEPNPVLVNINKLKPYKYVGQTLKGS